MRRPATLFTIVLGLGAIILAPGAGAQEQDWRARGPIKIKQCQTIDTPGSYVLANNLNSPGGADCLVITAADVTIDLAGFSISGSAGNSVGIRGGRGIAVRNGSITGFGSGVELGNDSIVEGLRVFGGCPPLCSLGISATGIVKGNTVSGTRSIGISATGVISGNYVLGGGRLGFSIGEGSTVIGNTAVGNDLGFIVHCPSNVTDNTAVNSVFGNLLLDGEGCNNTNNVAL